MTATQTTTCLSKFRMLRPKVLVTETKYIGEAPQELLAIKSHKTGTVLEFKLNRTYTGKNDKTNKWIYLPVVAEGPISQVTIFDWGE